MKRTTKLTGAALILGGASLGMGYWLGIQGASHEEPAHDAATQIAASGDRKPLYYRNPMGLPDTSPVPKKDPMGMDYIPVYADENPAGLAGSASEIRIDTARVQKLGVRTELAQMRVLDRTVRAAGRIEPDERRLYTIAPKFEGYVERLHVNVTGQPVAKGQPLFEVYSPDLVSAQREYALAMRGLETLKDSDEYVRRGMRQLADSSLQRLKNWDISEGQIRALSRSGESRRTLTFHAPVAGIVSEKKAVQGMRFEAGESLYQILDLSTVWVLADVYEQDIGRIGKGGKATVQVSAYPDTRFEGKVAYVYPTLAAETRTVPVRIELPNPEGLLKPAMFAQVEIAVGTGQPMLTVPDSAVIDSGTRALVFVRTGEGRFEPREVKLGQRGDQYVEVLSGVHDQEPVVVSANFLIDAESNLRAAVGAFAPPSDAAAAPAVVGHHAEGVITAMDTEAGAVTLDHGPVDTLKWPAMAMEFHVANAALLEDLKTHQRVTFEFVERGPGEWIITRIAPQSAGAQAAH